MVRAVPIEQRFWARVPKGGPDECWIWPGSKCGNGYGSIRADRQRRMLQTHRLSFELTNGPIPLGMHVLHRCDTPACVNPAHLFLGTHQDNMNDKRAKGREVALCGELNGQAKLTRNVAQAIFEATGFQYEIARKFGVSQTTVWRVKTRQHWAVP